MKLFKEGDIVEWGGVCGTVLNKRLNYGEDDVQYILIDFKKFGQHYFLEDGRQSRWQTKPVLVPHKKSETFEIPVYVKVQSYFEEGQFQIDVISSEVHSSLDISKVNSVNGILKFTLEEE